MLKTIAILSVFLLVVVASIGGYENVDVEDEDVRTAADHASQALSRKFSSKYLHKLVKVIRAKKQVVAGYNYQMDIIVGMTDCMKEKHNEEHNEDCDFQNNVSTYKKCTVVVYRDLKGNHKLVTSGCILASKNEV